MLQQIARGGAQDLLGVARYDSNFAEGQAGELCIGIRQIPFLPDLPPGFVGALNLALDRAPGLDVGRVSFGDDNVLRIPFRRGIPPLIAIAAILAIFFVGAILLLVVSWALFREPFEQLISAGADVGRAVAKIGEAVAKDFKPLLYGGLALGVLLLITQGGKRLKL